MTDAPGAPQHPDRSDDQVDAAAPSMRDAFAGAMRGSGLGQVAPGEMPTAKSLLAAVGGVRGLVEAILPALGFLVIYTITGELVPSVLFPVAVAVVFVVIRLVSRTPVTQAFAGVAGVGVSAVLALMTGNAEDNFLPGIITNVISLTVVLVSLLVRYPIIGLIVGVLSNEGLDWRRDRAKRRVLTVATVLWAGLFALRLAVAVPLYLAQEVELLAATKLILGVPLYAVLVWVTWMLVQSVYRRDTAEGTAPV